MSLLILLKFYITNYFIKVGVLKVGLKSKFSPAFLIKNYYTFGA